MSDHVANIGLAYVLEDDRALGGLACQFLQAIGYCTRQFEVSSAFLASMESNPPDVILLDLATGQTDAVDVMRKLSAQEFAGFVLLMGARDQHVLVEVQAIGSAYGLQLLPPLQKPIRLAALRQTLAAVPRRGAPMHHALARHVRIDPAEALNGNWLELWYQPKIQLKTNTVCGAEALLRARHPQFGVLAPAAFLPDSDDPLHHAILEFVFRRSITDWRRLGHRPELSLAINVPVSVICSGALMALLRRFSPGSVFSELILEVAENEVIQDASWAREVATQLSLHNVFLSIDDFGAGVESLSRLCELPFIELKLDRAYVAGCATNWANHAACQAAVKLARIFGATLCAEGVESTHDLAMLRQLGFDTAQGFLLGKPMPLDQFALTVLGRPVPADDANASGRPDTTPGTRLTSVA